MKNIYKLLSAIALMGVSTHTNAQVATNYTFSQSSAAYSAITGGSVIGSFVDDDAAYGNLNIGFTVKYNGACYNQFGMGSNSYFSFGPATPGDSYNQISGSNNNIISVFNYDTQLGSNITSTVITGSSVVIVSTTVGIAVGGTISTGYGFPANTTVTAVGANSFTASALAASNITGTGVRFLNGEMRYQTLGAAPNRTLVVQWKNMRNWGSGQLDQNFNYQLLIEETTNKISIKYGNYVLPTGSYVYLTGLRGLLGDFNTRTTATNWLATTVGITNTDGCILTPTITPTVGLTFNWTTSITTPASPTVAIAITGATAACGSGTNIFTASGANTYTWNSGATTTSINPTSTVSTVYTVVGTATNNCTDTKTVGVVINAIPTVSVNSGAICAGTSFTMVGSGASTYTFSSGSAVVSPTTNSFYNVTGTSAAGCVSSNTAVSSVTVNSAPSVSIIGSSVVCAGSSATLVASGANTYSWNTGATSSSIAATPTANTTYTAMGTNTITGCMGMAIKTISVNALPIISITSNSAICSGNSTTLTASGANTYTWNTGANTSVIAATPTSNTTYTAMGTNSVTGCVGMAMQTVSVNAIPTVSVNSGAICAGTSFTMVASGASTYTYSSGSAVVSPTANASYNVTGSSAAGCVSSNTAVSSVTVNALPSVSLSAAQTTACTNGSTITLTGSPAGGTYTGTNVSGTIFTPGASAGTFMPTYAYTSTVTGCSKTATTTIIVSVCTGIDSKIAGLSGIELYPNPNTGIFIIELNNGLNKTIQVTDLTGRIVLEDNTNSDKFNVNINALVNGIYYVKVISNNAVEVFKVIKQ